MPLYIMGRKKKTPEPSSLDKILWTRMKDCPANQFDWWEHRGFRIYAPENFIVSNEVKTISLKVKVKSEQALTLHFSPALYTFKYMVATPYYIITPGEYQEVTIDLVNPALNSGSIHIEKGLQIATMVVLNNRFCNLLEVSNKYSETR